MTEESQPGQTPASQLNQASASPPDQAPAGWFTRLRRRLFRGIGFLLRLLLIGWTALAIYYSNLPWAWLRIAVALAFCAFAVWALWITSWPRRRSAFVAVFAVIAIWWSCIPPSHDRPWRREVDVLPRAVINGDRVQLLNTRSFVYRSTHDFDVRYVDREVSLEHLVSVDLYVSYWEIGPVAHTFLSFNFDDGSPPVCISIETRPEVGEGFDPLASMFKQFELIYVVGDERDLVRVRTDHRNEEVFLYRINAPPEAAQQLFRIYLDRINHLAEHPEWYHLLKNNCTLNIIRYSRAVGGPHGRFELSHWLNGLIDRYLYSLGIVDTSLGFEELRRRSHINEASRAAGDAEDYSEQIRADLPVPAGR